MKSSRAIKLRIGQRWWRPGYGRTIFRLSRFRHGVLVWYRLDNGVPYVLWSKGFKRWAAQNGVRMEMVR